MTTYHPLPSKKPIPSPKKSRLTLSVSFVKALLFVLVSGISLLRAQDAGSTSTSNSAPVPAPKPLIDITSPDALKQIKPNYGDPVSTIDKTGLSVTLPAARANYPGIQVYPPSGDSWDLTPYGHIEAKITNTGTTLIRMTMRVDGTVSGQPGSDVEIIGVKPGESKVLKVIFGYAWGFKPGGALEQGKIQRILLICDQGYGGSVLPRGRLPGSGCRGREAAV